MHPLYKVNAHERHILNILQSFAWNSLHSWRESDPFFVYFSWQINPTVPLKIHQLLKTNTRDTFWNNLQPFASYCQSSFSTVGQTDDHKLIITFGEKKKKKKKKKNSIQQYEVYQNVSLISTAECIMQTFLWAL